MGYCCTELPQKMCCNNRPCELTRLYYLMYHPHPQRRGPSSQPRVLALLALWLFTGPSGCSQGPQPPAANGLLGKPLHGVLRVAGRTLTPNTFTLPPRLAVPAAMSASAIQGPSKPVPLSLYPRLCISFSWSCTPCECV